MRMRLVAAAVAAFVVGGLVVPAATTATAAEPGPAVAAGEPTLREKALRSRPRQRLQVGFKRGVGPRARADALAKAAARGRGVGVERRLDALNAAVVRADDPAAVARLLREDDRVAYVEPTSIFRPAAVEPRSAELTEIGVAPLHDHATDPNLGAGSQIAILDSPVSTTIGDLDSPGKVTVVADTFTEDYDESPGDPWRDFACDAVRCPHGTGVATAAAAEADGAGMVGVAPAATIRSYTVFRRWTYTDPDTREVYHDVSGDSVGLAEALVAVGDYAATHPELVAVNMSLSGVFDSRLLQQAVAYLHEKAPRVTIVAAAGNDGGERANFPAGDPYVLSVGATGQVPRTLTCADAIDPATPWSTAWFSNRGDVDVVAPGRCVDVWYPTMDETTGEVDVGSVAVRKEDGTSFAAPMVAGIAALLATDGVTGDAARAAIIASAGGAPGYERGAGKADAGAAVALATGVAPYTALTLDRGAQVASNVGRRGVEVIRVDPTGTTEPIVPTPTVPAGYGAFTAGAATSAPGVATRRWTFAVADVSRVGVTFAMTADGGAGGDDVAVQPIRLLDSTNGHEGVQTASGETSSAALTYGKRSAYLRSFVIPWSGAKVSWSHTFGSGSLAGVAAAELLLWEPTTSGGAADAAMEPFWASSPPAGTRSGSGSAQIGGAGDVGCEYVGPGPDDYAPCKPGRYVIGFLTYGPTASSSSTSRYTMRPTWSSAPTVTATAPAVASSASTTGPFAVSWGGTRAVAWDVAYAVKTKVGSTWTITAWKPWRTKTPAKSGVFGAGNVPERIAPGKTYHLRVKAYDRYGNPTLSAVRTTSVPFDDRSSSIGYSAGWTSTAATGRWLGTARKTSTAGAKAWLTSETSRFRIVGDRCSTCGQIRVYVDGVYKGTVDTYRSSLAVRQVLWTSAALGSVKSHRIAIVVVGTRGRPKVVLDGISILR